MSIKINKYKKSRRSSGRNTKRKTSNAWHPFFKLSALIITGFVAWKVVFWVFSTNLFAIDQISVSGIKYLTVEEVRAQVEDLKGINTFKILTEEYETKLGNLPYVREARIYRSLPSEIHVEIMESDLLAFINTGNSLVAVDVEGNIVAPPRKGNVYDLPLISQEKESDTGFLNAINFLRAAKVFCPEVFAKISEVKITGKNHDIYALVDYYAKPVRIGNGNYKEKVLKLWVLLSREDVDFKSLTAVDLRFPGKVFFTRS